MFRIYVIRKQFFINYEKVKNDTLLTFDYIGFSKESEHISFNSSEEYIPEKLEHVSEMVNKGEPFSIIANEFEISKGTISKWKIKYPNYFQ